jgi:cyclopropane fatty-acyl-phospholipid synthase-like methyltransferase
MSIFRRLLFGMWYLRHPPWDRGIVPPEVEDFIEKTSPGRALDLGCGSGTSSIALARAGWSVTGVDFIHQAIAKARRKAHEANVVIDFQVAEVTRLPESVMSSPFDLVLDIGCFHGLSGSKKAVYFEQLDRLLLPGGTWMLYGFFDPVQGTENRSAVLESSTFKLIKRQNGVDRKERASAWMWFKKVG